MLATFWKKKRFLLIYLLLPFQVLQGCTSMYAIENANDYNNVISQVHVNDFVRITNRNGEVFNTQVLSITEDKIIGKNTEVPFSDISQLEIKKVDQDKKRRSGTG